MNTADVLNDLLDVLALHDGELRFAPAPSRTATLVGVRFEHGGRRYVARLLLDDFKRRYSRHDLLGFKLKRLLAEVRRTVEPDADKPHVVEGP